MYRYLNICSDDCYQGNIDASEALNYILSIPSLKQTKPAFFESTDPNSWFLVSLLHCHKDGGYNSDGELPAKINLIEVISEADNDKASEVAQIIAQQLGWRVIDVSLD